MQMNTLWYFIVTKFPSNYPHCLTSNEQNLYLWEPNHEAFVAVQQVKYGCTFSEIHISCTYKPVLYLDKDRLQVTNILFLHLGQTS